MSSDMLIRWLLRNDTDADTAQAKLAESLRPAEILRVRDALGYYRFALWFEPQDPDTKAAREIAATQSAVFADVTDKFALWIAKSTIDRDAEKLWNELPKVYFDTGNQGLSPNANGDVRLDSYEIKLVEPDTVVTTIRAHKDGAPWAPLGTTLCIQDRLVLKDPPDVAACLRANADYPEECATRVAAETTNDRGVDGLSAFWVALSTLGFGFFGLGGGGGGGAPVSGAGAAIVGRLPRVIPVLRDQKLSFSYTDVKVQRDSILVAADFQLLPRRPSLRIEGGAAAAELEVYERGDVQVSFSTAVRDLGAGRKWRWTSDGQILDPTRAIAVVRFSAGSARPGEVLARRIAVTVSDEDGVTLGAQLDVNLTIVPRVRERDPRGSDPLDRARPSDG